jgi:ubiquinone/menaquinone biosynthesis C-methylase UbiE
MKGTGYRMDFRKKEEREFHNALRHEYFGQRWTLGLEKTIEENPLWVNMKYYSVERKSRDVVLKWLSRNCLNKKVLDYCCGNGEDALYIARNGAKQVAGIDISEVSIENCRKRASEEKLTANTEFLVMDAEALNFGDDTFDVITEYGSLHHLRLERAYSELARVVKHDGTIICNEALGHNPLINLYRKVTPRLRTEWEARHIICKNDLELAKRYFNKVEMNFFHLATLTAVPFRKMRKFDMLLTLLEKIDQVLLRLPLLKWQAWQIVFILSEPIKSVKR